MKKLLNKAERRFGKYSIQGLMKYIIAIEIAGAVIGIINPDIYYYYLSLDLSSQEIEKPRAGENSCPRLFAYV